MNETKKRALALGITAAVALCACPIRAMEEEADEFKSVFFKDASEQTNVIEKLHNVYALKKEPRKLRFLKDGKKLGDVASWVVPIGLLIKGGYNWWTGKGIINKGTIGGTVATVLSVAYNSTPLGKRQLVKKIEAKKSEYESEKSSAESALEELPKSWKELTNPNCDDEKLIEKDLIFCYKVREAMKGIIEVTAFENNLIQKMKPLEKKFEGSLDGLKPQKNDADVKELRKQITNGFPKMIKKKKKRKI